MSMLLVICLVVFVLVFAGMWIVVKLVGLAFGAVFWTARTAIGGGVPRASVERCGNDRCGAPWRDGARFCPRCGQPRRLNHSAPMHGDVALAHRPARAMTRVA